MNCLKYFCLILVIFFKTGNVLSLDNIFNVNNIEIVKKPNDSIEQLTNRAIKKGFKELSNKILLPEDIKKLSELNFSKIKELVSYYQVVNKKQNEKENIMNFNIFYDKDKLFSLFFSKNISYSEINSKELYLLPVFIKNNKIFIYNNNFFYNNWNKIYANDLIEFILPIENIEVIRNINLNKKNLFEINLNDIFKEYTTKNLALIVIEEKNSNEQKVYLRAKVLGKNINKNITIDRNNLSEEDFYNKIILKTSDVIVNIIKSQNLIDIRTPSFLNTQFLNNKSNSLVELNKRLKLIESIDGIYVQEFNKNYILLKIKYLGKLDKIINQLKNQNIKLTLIGDQWRLRIIK